MRADPFHNRSGVGALQVINKYGTSERTSLNGGWRLLPVLMVMILAGACCSSTSLETRTYLLRSKEADIQKVSSQMLHALAAELEAGGLLTSPYPVVGHVTTETHPSEKNVEVMRCAEGEPDGPEQQACIGLNREGDLIRVSPITWLSAAFHMYRIYVLPRSITARVDPAKDYVAIDVYLMSEPSWWQAMDEAIGAAAGKVGARPFHP